MDLTDKSFTYLSEKVILDGRLSHGAFRLYSVLKVISELPEYGNKTFSLTLKELSEITGKGRTTLINTLNDLEALGYIKRQHEVGGKNTYTVLD